MKDPIYLDHQTVAPPSLAAIEAALPFYKEYWGSPFALHQKGQELFAPIDLAMSRIFEAVGANFDDQFILTASGTEAISQVFFSNYIDFIRDTGRNHILTTAIESEAILHAGRKLERLDCGIKLLPVDACGRLSPETLVAAIKPRVALLSLAWANSLTGVIQPIADLARICREKNVRLHVDASAIIGKHFFRFKDEEIDYLSFGAEQIHGLPGAGGVFARKSQRLEPLLGESLHMNVGSLVGLGIAIKEAEQHFDTLCTETARLRNKFEMTLQEYFSDMRIFFLEAERLPNTTVLAFPGVASESLLYALNKRGVYATIGGGMQQKLAHVLESCGVESSLANSAVSFSLSYKTEESQVERAIQIIIESVRYARSITGSLL